VTPPTLLAVPNFSEGRDPEIVGAIAAALSDGARAVRLLDVHSDPDHHRSVFTLAGPPGDLAKAVLAGAREAIARIDLNRHQGVHPRVGALDVAPIVHLTETDRGAACAEALILGDMLGQELKIPVFLYGSLARGRTRAKIRSGGPDALGRRIAAGEIAPDFGPQGPRSQLHPTAGAALVAARPPLVAFNVELAPPATLEDAKAIAATIRDGGTEGQRGVRAIGLWLANEQVSQVSTNIEDHRATTLANVVSAVGRHATVQAAEIVGLAPRAAFDGWPDDVPLKPGRRTIEEALNP
jgi:glutamate formiminotransferase/glutamate formiminotransferase/formiminotetrahydrofolate cyclodeaminase